MSHYLHKKQFPLIEFYSGTILYINNKSIEYSGAVDLSNIFSSDKIVSFDGGRLDGCKNLNISNQLCTLIDVSSMSNLRSLNLSNNTTIVTLNIANNNRLYDFDCSGCDLLEVVNLPEKIVSKDITDVCRLNYSNTKVQPQTIINHIKLIIDNLSDIPSIIFATEIDISNIAGFDIKSAPFKKGSDPRWLDAPKNTIFSVLMSLTDKLISKHPTRTPDFCIKYTNSETGNIETWQQTTK